MKHFFKNLYDSASEFKNLRSIIIAAMLIAIHTVLSFFLSIPVTDTLRISISFIANCVAGLFFGPVVGLVCGAIGDIISYLIKPMGPFFLGWTLNAALAGFLYGIAFYKKYPKTKEEVFTSIKEKSSRKIIHKLPSILLLLGIILWFILPFLTVTTKVPEAMPEAVILTEGTARKVVADYLSKQGNLTAFILALLNLVMMVLILLLNLLKRKVLPLALSIFTPCATILAVYTDKKTMTGHFGFYIFSFLFVLCAFLYLVNLLLQRAIDISYLIRCLVVMAVVAIFVNSILGTYWVSIMQGKGFYLYFTSRLIKNLVQLPFNIMLVYLIMQSMKRLRR